LISKSQPKESAVLRIVSPVFLSASSTVSGTAAIPLNCMYRINWSAGGPGSANDRQNRHALGSLKKWHCKDGGPCLLGAAIPCNQHVGGDVSWQRWRRYQDRPAALKRAGFNRSDLQAG
jgi:hypothetical protein